MNETRGINKWKNSNKKGGVNYLARQTGEKKVKPITGVERDHDTPDGGRKGEITTNPKEVDGIIKRALTTIHDGVAGCLDEKVDALLNLYGKYVLKATEHTVPDLTAFTATKESAAAMDGWFPKEMSLLSPETCDRIATMLNQIEMGAPWPRSIAHTKVVVLEKAG